MLRHLSSWFVRLSRTETSALLSAVGLDVENQQKDPWNQDEQKAGDESEIVGFHGRWRDPGEGITDKRPEEPLP